MGKSKFQSKAEKKIETGGHQKKGRPVYYDEKIAKKETNMSKAAFAFLIGIIIIGAGTGSYFIFAGNNDNNGDDNTTTTTTTTTTTVPTGHPQVQMEIAGVGTIIIEFYPEYAPNTVASFLSLVNQDYYDGLTFHRVIADFVAQGGDGGPGEPGYTIDDELIGNLLTHVYGAISMAKLEAPDTAGSQFYFVLNEAACAHLNGVHTVFGQVISGLDLLPLISEGDVMSSVFELDV